MDRPGRRAVTLALLTTALLAAATVSAGDASAAAHGRAASAWAARSADRDADGRVDTLRIEVPARGTSGLRVSVRGHRVRKVAWHRAGRRRVATLRLVERARADTGSRQVVILRRRGGRAVRRIRAVDRARPVLMRAAIAAGGGGAASTLSMRFSEPVRFRGTAHGERVLAVSGGRVGSIGPVRSSRVVDARLADAGALPAAARVRILPARGSARITDTSGNVSVARAVSVSSAGTGSGADAVGGTGPWHVLSNPIDPRQQLDLPWGARSDWLQPWRAYLDTVPAARLRAAVGINFNVPAEYAAPVARLLADSGFRRARIEIPWGAMSYDDPTRLRDAASFQTRLAALRDNGIRPLVLLNSNHGVPCPATSFDARITEPAVAGARAVRVDDATRRRIVPGLSGFNGLDGRAAGIIVTSVSQSGWAQLAKPLPVDVPAGTYRASTLRYRPFGAPLTASGDPNPEFERTLSGWLGYVVAATRAVRDVLGTDDFDVEIWNELNFGSDFLRADRYYDPVPPELTGKGSVEETILWRTVAALRNRANGVSGVGIGNGFANQTPFASGATSPPGLTALDKHPYRGVQDFAGYRAFFPEYFLSGIQTETLVRDLSPITTKIGPVPHGRYTAPPGGSAPPKIWITETGLAPGGSGIDEPDARRRLQAKVALRDLVAFVNKGVSALYFYAVGDGDWAMLDPGAADGGETFRAVRRLTAALAGPATVSAPRSLRRDAIADRHDHVQFEGDGTAARPPLYNREVVAFLPFQVDASRFVVPAYVMTRDMSKVRRPDLPASDPARYDLPPETYRLTVGGLNAGRLRAGATDPLTGASVPVTVVSRAGDTAVLEVDLTDSPRLLVLEDG